MKSPTWKDLAMLQNYKSVDDEWNESEECKAMIEKDAKHGRCTNAIIFQ